MLTPPAEMFQTRPTPPSLPAPAAPCGKRWPSVGWRRAAVRRSAPVLGLGFGRGRVVVVMVAFQALMNVADRHAARDHGQHVFPGTALRCPSTYGPVESIISSRASIHVRLVRRRGGCRKRKPLGRVPRSPGMGPRRGRPPEVGCGRELPPWNRSSHWTNHAQVLVVQQQQP